MKSYYTAIYSTRFERGTHGAGSVATLKKRAAEAEAWIQEKVRMSFASESDWRSWLWGCSKRGWSECTACPLGRADPDRYLPVLGAGPMDPLLAIVGGRPGDSESERGAAWVDDSAAVMRKVCYKLGINLARDVWITHSVACPSRSLPGREAREACAKRLQAELSIVKPPVLLLLGVTAMRSLVGGRRSDLADHRGLVRRKFWPDLGEVEGTLKAVFLTHHPSILLESSAREKKRLFGEFVDDLRKVKRVIDLLGKRRRA